MRKVFIALAAIVVIIAGFMIAGLNGYIQNYRPKLVQLLNEKTPYTWQIGELNLRWEKGLVLDAQHLHVQAKETDFSVSARLDHLIAHLDAKALLSKKLHVVKLVLEQPEVLVDLKQRPKTQSVAAAVPVAIAGEAASLIQEQSEKSAQGPFEFRIDKVLILEGAIDVSGALANQEKLSFREVRADIGGLAPGKTVTVDLSTQSNSSEEWSLKAHVQLDPTGKPTALSDVTLNMENLRTQTWLPPRTEQDPYLHARVNLSWEGQLPSLMPNRVLKVADGKGTFQLMDPVLMRMHLLKTIFGQIPLMGEFADKISGRMPNHQAYWQGNRTRFETVQTPFVLKNGKLLVPDVSLLNEAFLLRVQDIQYDFEHLRAQGQLRVTPEFTQAALLDSFKEAGYVLVNDQGEMEMPLKIQYPEKPYVKPLVENLLPRAVNNVVGALLERVIEKNKPETPQETPVQAQPDPKLPQNRTPPTTEALVGEALRLILEKAQ